MSAHRKHIAVLGISLESNRFAPVFREENFHEVFYGEGERLNRALRRPEVFAFGERMSELRDWQPLPVLLAIGGAGGPMDHAFFESCIQRIEHELIALQPIDGVYLYAHGGGLTTQTDDLDGWYFQRVRETVGPDVPIVAVLDLHGMITTAMVEAADVLVAYRTNPHVDQPARSREAAELMNEMFEGMAPRVAWQHVPMMAPAVALGTGEGQPYGDLIETGQTRCAQDPRIANVSILCGFNPADSVHNGFHVVVTGRGSQAAADALATELAERAWRDRGRYELNLTPLHRAVDIARMVSSQQSAEQWILADVADNPGGGARGNTTFLLRALLEAGVGGVLVGLFYDPALAAEAHQRGEGAMFLARFNRDETNAFSEALEWQARVVALTDATVTPRRGMLKGRSIRLGPCALLELGGVQVVVSSVRQQITSDDYFIACAADPAAAQVFVVKSRGHFRAGFDHLVPDERIVEVDCPGLATPNLQALPWRDVRRPIYPLDPDLEWTPDEPYRRRGAQFRGGPGRTGRPHGEGPGGDYS